MDLSELNEAQRAAVTAPDGAHLVVAGAGTGKTRTLVHRVAWLLEQGVPAPGIVLLTFTRRASAEMLDRVARIVGASAHGVRGGTFHSFANGALRRHADVLGYAPSFTILDRGDAESLVGMVRGELGLGGSERRFAKRGTILNVLSRAVNTSKPIADVLEDQYPQYASDVADFERIAVRYAERKKAQGVVDFDDLLVLLAKLLTEHPEARRALSHAARHVLVDEYQDTNRLQAKIAALLSSVHGNLMVVGDEAQSIYGFRGAVVDNILDFPAMFEGTRLTLPEEHYRTAQPILDLANGILEGATRGYGKHLRSRRLEGPMPLQVEVEDEHRQVDWLVGRILELREQGVGLAEQAVLFRAAHHAYLLEVALADADIPYVKYGGLRFSEAAHIKDVFALLRIVANPRDALAWFRVLGWIRGVGARTCQQISDAIVEADIPVLDASRYKSKRYFGDLVSLGGFLGDAALCVHDVDATVTLAIDWYRDRIEDIHEDWKKRVRDLDALPLLAERFTSLDAFLAEVALDPVQESEVDGPPDPEEEVLTLSTVHSAKGLEWDAVHILQLADGAFPSAFAIDDPDDLEEERRLFYVAVTRARCWLSLITPRFMRMRRGPVVGPGCTLLDQVPHVEDLVEVLRPGAPTWDAPLSEDAAEVARLARMLGFFQDS